ncbi:GNAT family N-acetyltransferase [Variovorax sp. Sphag1AA]|uniref:GNAT family N-acetyltransferase n=1 Tax=Variovorax sp. Sphag1AA TaxID=2587027 RepID=UPI00161F3B34|nr:GNAT family N-acetyltransferase [Variovorax sp. Sphag1AA]MBB3177461.1 RimJ/RimL family protein N-acetyltransferase [Variovorax sp. Sphag1AA]
MAQCIEFDTERLRLRQWRESDRAPFAALNADVGVMEFFLSPLSRAESDAMVDRVTAVIDERGWGLWAVEERASGNFIGFVGLSIPRPDLPCSPCVEVGWRLAPAFWGKGYALEAARAALCVGFERIGLQEIVSFTAALNLRSEAVMQRLGMRADGVFENPALPEGHPLRPHKLYRLDRTSWSTSSRSCGNTFDTFASR